MAQSPTVELPSRLPLMVITSNRNDKTDKDARLVNCYLETDKSGELWIYKRPGLAAYSTIVPNQLGRGLFYWRKSVYSIFGNTLFKDGISIFSGLDTSNGLYRFDSNLGATPQLIFGNGKSTYAYTEGGAVVGPLVTVDTDFPVEVVKGFAYLNGYEYVMTPSAYIHNSELNSVASATSWNPINFIRAQIEPDDGIALAKQLVYVVALKEWTTEFFYNTENAVGSPLGAVQGMKVNYGCASSDSVRSIDDILFWLSTNRSASNQIISMDKGATTIISTPAIDRLLADADTSVVYSWHLKIVGHSFYVITFKNSNLTLAYDIPMDQWFQWTDENGNYFPIVDSAYDVDGNHILQHETNGRMYRTDATLYLDLDKPIIVDIITPIFDAGVRRRKHLGRMWAIADQTVDSQLMVRYSENDYKDWSNWRYLDLNQDEPFLMNCGTFTKRAYHLRHQNPTPFRIQAIELQYDLGTL